MRLETQPFRLLLTVVLSTICIVFSAQASFADGFVGTAGSDVGGGGPFRRAKTNFGYCGVKGNFTIPTLFLAPLNSNTRTTPDLYLGGGQQAQSGSVEIDAGMDYERGNPYAKDGWTVVVRVSGGPTGGVTVNPKPAWRAGPGTPNANVTSFDLTWLVDTSRLTGVLSVNAHGAQAQPNGNGNIPAANGMPIFYNQSGGLNLYVKRVMAVAQTSTAYKEEGSYMRGSVFTSGQVLPIGSSWIPYSAASLNQTTGVKTGYGPDGKDHGVGTSSKNIPSARYIVDFPGRGTTDAARNASDPSRYDAEAVDINMMLPRKTAGKLIIADKPGQ